MLVVHVALMLMLRLDSNLSCVMFKRLELLQALGSFRKHISKFKREIEKDDESPFNLNTE
jgi:hypothetical protein